MNKSRKHIRDRTKLAAMICIHLEIPYEEAKARTEDEIIGLAGEWDHYPHRHADGGPSAHYNLRPLFPQDHLEKTKLDAKDMAKERKVRRAVDEHKQRMLLKGMGKKPIKKRSSWPKRPFPKKERASE